MALATSWQDAAALEKAGNSPLPSADFNKVLADLQVLGGTVASKTTTYTATDADGVILCNATSAAFTVTLPTAVGRTGKRYSLIKTDSSANAITVDPSGAETINGDTTVSLATQYATLAIVSNGTNWIKVINASSGGGYRVTLDAGSWEFPAANFPQTDKYTGLTNWETRVLRFDAATEESCKAKVPLPSDAPVATVRYRLAWINHTVTANDVKWGIAIASIADGEDANTAGTETAFTDTAPGTAKRTNIVTGTLTLPAGLAAGELLRIKLARKAADVADTLAEDAYFESLTLEFL